MTYDGARVVAAAGTRVALMPTRTPAAWVVVQSNTTNTAATYVGGPTVSPTSGYELAGPGDWIPFRPIGDLNAYDLSQIFVDAVVNGEGVKFIYQRR